MVNNDFPEIGQTFLESNAFPRVKLIYLKDFYDTNITLDLGTL